MDAEVYWGGRLVGHLRGVTVDQPYYRGRWSPAGDAGFEQAYRELQAELPPTGRGMLPVEFRAPDGSTSVPAAAMVRPDVDAPYFRFWSGGPAPVAHKPTPRDCKRCGQPIPARRLGAVPAAVRCWDCQAEVERQGT